MDLDIDPPRRVGPIEIGMPFDRAARALQDIPGFTPPLLKERNPPGFAHYESEMSIALEPGRDGRVKSIEIYRPTRNINVLYRGISIFGESASDVIRKLAQITRLKIEDDGLGVLAHELLMSLGRAVLPEGPDDPDGRYFESVLIAAPGYYE
ncbi:hypothetical protein HNR23_000281 [Nocardiopsis mwathae]|uniref:Uncharacterized protein n=1 Tax=Nocardiopsis mwathae TaxID=1472723 RepID=A0A7W9YEY4_9ACTN|nr:hypothetical protein [Nocardiopsis mwathae]MBB6170221.1 hypothetical protein [Nocardiopsis mwathae]